VWPFFIALASIMAQGKVVTTPTTIADALEQAALNPQVVSTDKGRVESHDIDQLIAALRHESSQAAGSKNHFGLRIVKLEAPGAG
jgi:hypothetical protein